MNKEVSFQKLVLGECGLNHIKGLMGAKELSRYLIKTINSDEGFVFTWFPKSWEAKRFDDIHLKEPLTSSAEMKLKKIKTPSGSIVIVGDYMDVPTNKYIQSYLQNSRGVFLLKTLM